MTATCPEACKSYQIPHVQEKSTLHDREAYSSLYSLYTNLRATKGPDMAESSRTGEKRSRARYSSRSTPSATPFGGNGSPPSPPSPPLSHS
ncbi:hypothetical protein L1987_13145 [Smallanthus sonchifolius]|uniref:Uncharacterized protein n=1 Tax=Smallanthus sonchifolius TaxID=185202 RepID=A0ACB9JI36_9ASTR|nr:hypothetical protein L1987_13145 [Smallanthus sonchifolius]